MSIRAITLWQPWASLMAEGIKGVETRPNAYPWRAAIGEMVAIHAAIRRPPVARVGEWSVYGSRAAEFMTDRTERGLATGRIIPLPLGAVLAVGRLVAVLPVEEIIWTPGAERLDGEAEPAEHHGWASPGPSWRHILVMDEDPAPSVFVHEQERPFGDYEPGRSALLFEDIVRLEEPVPTSGHQGLWRWKGEES